MIIKKDSMEFFWSILLSLSDNKKGLYGILFTYVYVNNCLLYSDLYLTLAEDLV